MTPPKQPLYPPSQWRLLTTGLQDGPTNMGIDEAILEAVAAGESPPTLRFYGWQPACLSLGYAQSWEVVDLDKCAAQGWQVVRRLTGGRAILHTDELTYSLCLPDNDPRAAGGILESYQRISKALMAGLKLMGLEPNRAKSYYQDHGDPGPACFDGPSNYEITMGQHKLLGSAQVRKKGMLLQHGTLPLYGDIARIAHALYFDLPGQARAQEVRMRYRATTLFDSLGRRVAFDEAAEKMARGFSTALAVTLNAGILTATEGARAATLAQEKYSSDSWIKRL